jgi:hypothetical protein
VREYHRSSPHPKTPRHRDPVGERRRAGSVEVGRRHTDAGQRRCEVDRLTLPDGVEQLVGARLGEVDPVGAREGLAHVDRAPRSTPGFRRARGPPPRSAA